VTAARVLDLRDRELADRLRTIRQESGLSASQVSTVLGISQGQMTRIETAQRRYSLLHAATVLGLCAAPAAERDAVLELVGGADTADDRDGHEDRGGWWVRPHRGLPPETVRTVLFAHATAHSITGHHTHGLPLILRAQELLDHQVRDHPAERADAVWSAWWTYRAVLNRSDAPDLLYYLHEAQLRALPEAVREAQLIQLAMLAGQQRVHVRLIPGGTDARSNAFSLIRFSDAVTPAVCVPCDTVTLILEHHHVPIYQRKLAELDRIALSEPDSRELIMTLIDSPDTALSPGEYAVTGATGGVTA
jgi:transcriptional regulator with XRE-family HTH domain